MEPIEEREEYDAAITSEAVSVISFLADWSKPSKALKAELSEAMAKHGDFQFFEVDMCTDEGEELALDLGTCSHTNISTI